MDIRDTRDLVIPPYIQGQGLAQILKLQEDLLSHYIGIEGLPIYPVNVHIKKNQILLKDFIARITEEIGEGYESLLRGEELCKGVIKGNLNMVKFDHAYFNLFEELSDAMHFYMELFLYLGITEDKVYGHFDEVDTPLNRGVGCLENLYIMGTQLANWVLKQHRASFSIPPEWAFDKWVNFSELVMPEGGFLLNLFSRANTTFLYPHLAWSSTYQLQMARNTLKNKPWKQTEMMADTVLTEQNVLKSFVGFLGLCQVVGLNTEQLYYLYYRKNHINLFRIKSKY